MLAATALLLGLLAAAPAPAEEPAARRIESPLDRAVAALERADYPAALPELEQLAARGELSGLTLLGLAHRYGWGVAPDDKKAAALFRRAALRGHPPAQYWLGMAHHDGRGAAYDREESLKWLFAAAAAGLPAAYFELGRLYQEGNWLPYDAERSQRFLRLAAEPARGAAGDPRAQMMLGKERLAAKEPAAALRWYRLAAEGGYARAQLVLALFYTHRKGAEPAAPYDPEEALAWALVAAGDPELAEPARREAAFAARGLGADRIAAAEQRAAGLAARIRARVGFRPPLPRSSNAADGP